MDITLNPEMQRFVAEKVQAGQYASASDLVNDALAVLRDEEELTPEDIEELRRDVKIGIEEHRRGESTPLDMDAIKAQVFGPAGAPRKEI
ncbi:MAG: addiction module antidote protein family [Phycisphaerales bacterium]|nr:addiction module antidote protein family [Phycisphaerales bacterium]